MQGVGQWFSRLHSSGCDAIRELSNHSMPPLILLKVQFNHFYIPIFLTVYKGICVNQKYINCEIDTCTSKTKAVTMKHNLKLKNVTTIHNILKITCFKTFNVYYQYLTKTATSKAPTILK